MIFKKLLRDRHWKWLMRNKKEIRRVVENPDLLKSYVVRVRMRSK